jgi:2-keto-4-pentenoate hydratase
VDVWTTARLLDDAHRDGTSLRSADVEVGDLATAYLVQGALTALRIRRGAGQVGWKLGYTSEAMRRQMGVDRPNHGPLLSTMRVRDGASVTGLLQPRVEPEIALVVERVPHPGAPVDEVLAGCAGAHAALEIVDSVWEGYEFDVEHNTADGSSAAGVVVGAELPLDVLGEIEVRLHRDDGEPSRGRGSDAAGHPALALRWLAGALHGHPRGLLPGDLVITGGLTAAVPLSPGGLVHATFEHASMSPVTVGVRR